MRNARLCRMLASQGADVVCPTISLFHEVQRWNRENIPGYREIYLRVPLDELRRRDRKGIYAAAQRGDAQTSSGSTCRPRFPRHRIWCSTISARSTAATAVERIWAECAGPDDAAAAKPVRFVASKPRRNLETRWRRGCASGQILPQVRFSVGDWRADAAGVLARYRR